MSHYFPWPYSYSAFIDFQSFTLWLRVHLFSILHLLPRTLHAQMASNSPPLPLDPTFDKDDLHFRTVTSLLNLFNRPDRKHYECTVSKDARRNFKRMLGLTMLLARGTEVVACMPKRSVDGITLFCVPDKKHTKLRDYTRHDLLVAKNPPPSISGSPISTLRFSQIDSPQFVSTVNYLLQKWCGILLLILGTVLLTSC